MTRRVEMAPRPAAPPARAGPAARARRAAGARTRGRTRAPAVGERGFRSAQNMRVGPCIPAGIQLEKAEVSCGDTARNGWSWPNFWADRRPSHMPLATLIEQRDLSLVGSTEALWRLCAGTKGQPGVPPTCWASGVAARPGASSSARRSRRSQAAAGSTASAQPGRRAAEPLSAYSQSKRAQRYARF